MNPLRKPQLSQEATCPHLAAARFWQRLGRMPASDPTRAVHLMRWSKVDTASFEHALREGGLTLVPDPSAADVIAAVVDTLGDVRLAAANQAAVAARKVLFVLKPIGMEIEYGRFVPEGGCWACFEPKHRLLDGTATYVAQALALDAPVTEPSTYTPASLSIAYQMAVLAILLDLYAETPSLGSHLVAVGLPDLLRTVHPVVRLPHCPVCGVAVTTPAHPPRPALDLHQPLS